MSYCIISLLLTFDFIYYQKMSWGLQNVLIRERERRARKNSANKKPRATTNSDSSLLWGCCTGRNDNSHLRSLFVYNNPHPAQARLIQEGKLNAEAPLRRCALLHYLCSVVHYPYTHHLLSMWGIVPEGFHCCQAFMKIGWYRLAASLL